MIATGQFTIADLNDITTSATAPRDPVVDMLWLDTTTNELKKWNGTAWVAATKYTDDTAVNNLSIGGRNLLKTEDMKFTGITCTKSKYNKYDIVNNSSQYGGLTIPYSMFEANEEYILSYKFIVTSGTVTKIGGHSSAYTTIDWYVDDIKISTPYSTAVDIDASISIHNVLLRFKALPDSTGTTDLYIQLNRGLAETFTASVYDVKIEKGNKATDFTPAPEDVDEKIKNKVTTWYYSGTPTLVNQPADNWNTTEERNEHIGDLYYDKDTGYCYIFNLTGTVYSWQQVKDEEITEALSIANAAKDTADNKRRVFLDTPKAPYDNGDLWINNGEIFICQISKGEGETFEEADFINNLNYTDDSFAVKVNDELTVVAGQVLKIKESTDEYKISFEKSIKTINERQQETTEALETMSYTFDTDDLTIANSNDPVNTRINNRGMKVYSYDELKMIANNLGVGVQKLIVVGDSQIANLKIVKATDENNQACTDFHHLVSNFQTLSDLEV